MVRVELHPSGWVRDIWIIGMALFGYPELSQRYLLDAGAHARSIQKFRLGATLLHR